MLAGFWCNSESLGGLLKTEYAGLTPELQFQELGWGLRTCIPNKFPGDAKDAAWGAASRIAGLCNPRDFPASL